MYCRSLSLRTLDRAVLSDKKIEEHHQHRRNEEGFVLLNSSGSSIDSYNIRNYAPLTLLTPFVHLYLHLYSAIRQ